MVKRLFLLFSALFLFSCASKEVDYAASIFPLRWLVQNLYPDAEVYQIVKPGSNPHLYDLTPRDAAAVERAKKVFLIGNLEPFASKVPPSKRVEVIKLLNLSPDANPHLWLSPRRWLETARRLPSAAPPPDGEALRKTLEVLKKLDARYSVLKEKNLKAVLIYPAFYWLCKDYGVEILEIVAPSPGEPSPRKLVKAAEALKKHPDALILYPSEEPAALRLAQELKKVSPSARLVALETLVNLKEGDYAEKMEENLKRMLESAP